jgi:hypothetical protein
MLRAPFARVERHPRSLRDMETAASKTAVRAR